MKERNGEQEREKKNIGRRETTHTHNQQKQNKSQNEYKSDRCKEEGREGTARINGERRINMRTKDKRSGRRNNKSLTCPSLTPQA